MPYKSNIEIWKDISGHCKKISLSLRKCLSGLSKRDSYNRKERALVHIVRRIDSNLLSIYYLGTLSANRNGNTYLKLSVGLLIRSCLMDCITGLNLANNDENRCNNLLELWNRDYVKALFEEFEVYKDKCSLPLADENIEYIYTMCIEDTFSQDLQFNVSLSELGPMNERSMWKARDPKTIYSDYKTSDGKLKYMKDEISGDDAIGSCVTNLYAYYKYFSQYEHFSERGEGDSLANFGDDNIKFVKVFSYIEEATKYIMEVIQ